MDRKAELGIKQENVWRTGVKMTIAYWCVLVAGLLPLAFVAYAKSEAHDNNAPRDAAQSLSGPKRRAYAAHQNAYDNFPLFAAAVIIAIAAGASISTVNSLALLYVMLRIVHGLLYITDQATLRTVTFCIALLVNIAIFVLPAFK
jgi:uncharacterized MAPEG superfamily protein